jgi:hypothetical protein
MNAAKVAAVRKSEDTPRQFECDIDVYPCFGCVGTSEQFGSVPEPHKLAVEPEMQSEQAAIQDEKNVFASTINTLNAAASAEFS